MRLAAAVLLLSALSPAAEFRSARPVWPEGMHLEKNLFCGFRAVLPPAAEPSVLRVTGSTVYRIFVDGEFRGYGPARGPVGWFRVDEWTLPASRARSVVSIEVAGYNVNSYYYPDQPSFLQAEVVSGGKVLASTAGTGAPFEAFLLRERVQKVQRYSFQRPFIEVYRLTPSWDAWRRGGSAALPRARLAVLPGRRLLARGVPYPEFHLRQPVRRVGAGSVEPASPARIWKDRSLTQIGPELGGFPEAELDTIPSIELQRLFKGRYETWDFGTNLTGFVGGTITCRKPGRVYITFDEILTSGDVDFKRLGCVNAVTYDLAPGAYQVESFEPYTMRYAKFLASGGDFDFSAVRLREYVNPETGAARFASSDERLNRIFEAGRETFRQNAVDIFTDCPSRERAGWLCDSFFTARVAPLLGGNTSVERNLFENYLLPERFANLPDGMLPMCYPADQRNGVFIPNWSLWFVLQLEEYAARSGDRAMVDALRPRVMRLFEYFKPFRNSDGLLEDLKSWVFIEWSAANNFVQNVNYPSNMLYAAALAAAGRMYADAGLLAQAEAVRAAIRRQSFDGEFFVDNAVRKNGALTVTRNRTEVCQYFAFYFGTATPESHPVLWRTLREKFGPGRKEKGAFPGIHPANAFVGNVLRLEMLSRVGLGRQIVDETRAYLLYMAERTGTLWENITPTASCNHGFASHAVNTLYRDVLGLYRVDSAKREVQVRFTDSPLEWCEGTIPVPGGAVSLRWWDEKGAIAWRCDVPAGYKIAVENPGGRRLQER